MTRNANRTLTTLFAVGAFIALAGQFAEAAVIPVVPGRVGGPADFLATGSTGLDREGVATFWVVFDPFLITVPGPDAPFGYRTNLRWEEQVRPEAVMVREMVRGPEDQRANLADFGITPELVLDDRGAAIGARSGATFESLPFPVISYHVQVKIARPQALTDERDPLRVLLQKQGKGGRIGVVPEPSAVIGLVGLGLLGIVLGARRRHG